MNCCVQTVCNAIQIIVEEIRVGIERHRRFGAAKHPLNSFHIGVRAHCEAGRCVTEVVGSDCRKGLVRSLALRDCGPEHPRTPIGVTQNAAALVGEHQIIASFTGHQRSQFVAQDRREGHKSPKALDKSKAGLAQRMHASGESASTIAATLDVSRATVYRVLAEQTDNGD
jgi:Helix-turn-helix domain of resolvase